MTVTEDLTKAYDAFKGAEWVKHRIGTIRGGKLVSACMLGALRFAVSGTFSPVLQEDQTNKRQRTFTAVRLLQDVLFDDLSWDCGVITYNDCIAETKEDCEAMFVKAINLSKEEARQEP